jgi:hypothetical protein
METTRSTETFIDIKRIMINFVQEDRRIPAFVP